MLNTKLCSNCQTENFPDATTCVQCGKPLETESKSNTTEKVPEGAAKISAPQHIIELTQLHADVIVFQVLGQEQPILIKGGNKITFGRFNPGETSPTVDLNPYNASLLGVSRHHAVVTRTGKGYAIEDVGSTNGTYLNELKLTPHQSIDLRNGDLIRFGQLAVYAYFRVAEATPTQEATLRLKNQLGEVALKLTPLSMETTITPYINALAGIQAVHNALLQRPESDVTINAISADTDKAMVEIRLIGAKEAVQLTKNTIAPWRETYTAKISYLSSKTGAAEQPENNGTTSQLRRELSEAENVLALQILSDFAPDRPEDERKSHLEKLLPLLHTLAFSPLHIA